MSAMRRKSDGIMEFGLPCPGTGCRYFGADAAVTSGCVGTSCVLTGQMFDVPMLGTMHSWIMSFPDEYTIQDLRRMYPFMYPSGRHLRRAEIGVPNAIRVFEEMREEESS